MAELALMMGASAGTVATMGQIGTVLSTIGTVASIGGAISGYQSERASNSYNARVSENTARMQEFQNTQDVAKTKRENYLRQGAGVARAGNLTGSVLDILGDNAYQQELDVLNVKATGQMAADTTRSNAALNKSRNTTSPLSMGGKILTGASKLYGST